MNTEDYKTIKNIYEIIKALESIQGSQIEIKDGPTSCQYTNEEQPKVIIITIADGADCTNVYYWLEDLLLKAKRRQIIDREKFSHDKFNQLKQ